MTDDRRQNRNEMIESRIKTEVASTMQMSELGVAFRDMGEIMEFAKMMAVSGPAVPPVFRGEPGACLAVAIKAHALGFEPFSFASKCYFVNEQLAYEGQLIHAIITRRGPFVKRPTVSYSGDGQERRCHVILHMAEPDGDKLYDSPPLKDIKPQNSPLWKSDPDQQLHYYSVRAAARRHTPDVILGMYDVEEMAAIAARDITPKSAVGTAALQERLANGAKVTTVVVDHLGADGPQTGAEAPGANPTGEAAGAPAAPAAPAGDAFEDALHLELSNALKQCATRPALRVVNDEFVVTIDMMSPTGQQKARAAISEKARELGVPDGEEI